MKKQILKVRDHCHFTGEYRGAAHNQCNLECKKPLILLVIFLQGYDSHLFIKQLAKVSGDLSCIPSTQGGGRRLVDFSYLNHRRKYDVTSGEKVLLRSSELGSVLARRSAMS